MFDAKQLEEWISENGTGERERKYINDIAYLFVTMNDGWIAVFEIDGGSYIPKFQAADADHAAGRCSMIERPGIPFNVL